jgi:hypothetical protein
MRGKRHGIQFQPCQTAELVWYVKARSLGLNVSWPHRKPML